MIESISFQNFKALRNTTLPLGRFTLIVGPNGSGKSTALQSPQVAWGVFQANSAASLEMYSSAGLQLSQATPVEVAIRWSDPFAGKISRVRLPSDNPGAVSHSSESGTALPEHQRRSLMEALAAIRVYALDARTIAAAVGLTPGIELGAEGQGLAGVLDRLRDEEPERFEALNQEIGRLLPEFDRILFKTPGRGERAFLLRTREGQYRIRAAELSHGTLLALAMLTLSYLQRPPPIIALEEPDRGLHPRLLLGLRDALYRLSYPESVGESRPPVQVVATTHSPYFLDLFKDHPEEIVIAEKDGLEARFQRLVDRPDINEILADAPLGEVWYSGVLGGVPRKP